MAQMSDNKQPATHGTECSASNLRFYPLTIADRHSLQRITLDAGRRNCNLSFANLAGWSWMFGTQLCTCATTAILRYTFDSQPAFMICSATPCAKELVLALRESCAPYPLLIVGLEDDCAAYIQSLFPTETIVEPVRNSYDYIYLRAELEQLAGKELKAKRNHVNKFRAEHPDFIYRPLSPDLFDQCASLTERWRTEHPHDNPSYGDTIAAEHRVMNYVFDNWDELGMIGGSIFVDGRMVAFTYGSPITHDTFDVCVEKADRLVDGAFSIINQQFAAHIPEQYIYINREEDMGIEGLRKAKLSYHPAILLSYNMVTIRSASNPDATISSLFKQEIEL